MTHYANLYLNCNFYVFKWLKVLHNLSTFLYATAEVPLGVWTPLVGTHWLKTCLHLLWHFVKCSQVVHMSYSLLQRWKRITTCTKQPEWSFLEYLRCTCCKPSLWISHLNHQGVSVRHKWCKEGFLRANDRVTFAFAYHRARKQNSISGYTTSTLLI